MASDFGLTMKVSNNDIMEYIRVTAEYIKPYMDARHIDFVVRCMPESMMGWVDTGLLSNIMMLPLLEMTQIALENESVSSGGRKIKVIASTNKNYDSVTIRFDDNCTLPLVSSIGIVHRLVVAHKGNMRNTHYERQGNTCVIELPITKETYPAVAARSAVDVATPSDAAFHIPTNVTLHVPTIHLPENLDVDQRTLGTLVQETYESPHQQFLHRAIKCINDHLDDSDYDRDAFAADMGASASTLYNKLRAATGMNVTSFIRNIRIKAACRMAKEHPELRVSDIAYKVGFKDPKYFATTFKKEMGVQPKEYFDKLRVSD